MLDYENLDVYQRSLDLAALSAQVRADLPRGYSDLANQLHRAATSITLNISEGYGKKTANDQKNFHAISRGSAAECSAIFDILDRLDLVV